MHLVTWGQFVMHWVGSDWVISHEVRWFCVGSVQVGSFRVWSFQVGSGWFRSSQFRSGDFVMGQVGSVWVMMGQVALGKLVCVESDHLVSDCFTLGSLGRLFCVWSVWVKLFCVGSFWVGSVCSH